MGYAYAWCRTEEWNGVSSWALKYGAHSVRASALIMCDSVLRPRQRILRARAISSSMEKSGCVAMSCSSSPKSWSASHLPCISGQYRLTKQSYILWSQIILAKLPTTSQHLPIAALSRTVRASLEPRLCMIRCCAVQGEWHGANRDWDEAG